MTSARCCARSPAPSAATGELFETMPTLAHPTTSSTFKQLLTSMSAPRHFIEAAVYAAIVTISRLLSSRPDASWGRDETSRLAA